MTDIAGALGLGVLLWSLAMVPAVAAEDCADLAARPGADEQRLSGWETGDRVVLWADGAEATVCYENDGAMTSNGGAWRLQSNGIELTGRVAVKQGPETLTITLPGGWMTLPLGMEEIDVEDGQSVTVRLVPAMM